MATPSARTFEATAPVLLKPRDFITLPGGAATWPMVPRGQQADRMRRVGVLMGGVTEVDAVAKAQLVAFAQGLRALGWTEGRNLRIDYRWPVGDIKRMQTDARRRNSMLSSSGPRSGGMLLGQRISRSNSDFLANGPRGIL
jgi:hypothetical protein